MEMKLRKFWPLVGVLCLSFASSGFAHSNYPTNGSSSSTYGSSTDSSLQSGQGTYQQGTFREITPNAGPSVAHGADVFITADFIWWKTVQDGLDYAITGVLAGGGQVDNPLAADVFDVGPARGRNAYVGKDWSPGFKVGLGLNMDHDGWDIYAKYTWLHSSDSNSITGDPVFMGTLGIAGEGGDGDGGPIISGDRANASWHLHFNVIDLELGRNFYLSQFLTMRPFIGLKGTWQDQDWKVHFFSDNFALGITNPLDPQDNRLAVTGPYHRHQTFDTWGIGVRGGFNIGWYMSKSWSIYGDLAWTAMMANYDNHRDDLIEDNTDDVRRFKRTVHVKNDDFYAVRYVGELELGLRWETWFYDDDYHFSIQAGWEQQVWINWLRVPELIDQGNFDLSFHGLNLKFRFDF